MDQEDQEDRRLFALLLGEAVIDHWGLLPREAQERLFEAAVAARSKDVGAALVREQLALFLHKHHPRTEKNVSGDYLRRRAEDRGRAAVEKFAHALSFARRGLRGGPA